MNLKTRIRKELKIQQKTEGYTPETGLLLKILNEIKTASEWRAIVEVKPYRYGPLSYECHHFYYPSRLLNIIINLQDY